MMDPLVRIPCMLVAMISLHIAVTPPHPPPSEDEKAKSTRLEIMLKQRQGPLIVKCICWSAAIAEVAVVLSLYAPSSTVSNAILSILVLNEGGEQHIRATPLFFAGVFLTVVGGLIRNKCYQVLGTLFTYEMSIRKDHKLITTGPYALVRHPGYTGLLITLSGVICLHAGLGSWIRESGVLATTTAKGVLFILFSLVSSILIGLLKRMSKEDEALQKEFGHKWEEWARKVPYCLIPLVY